MTNRLPLLSALSASLLILIITPNCAAWGQQRYTGRLTLVEVIGHDSSLSRYYDADLSFRKVKGRYKVKEGWSDYFFLRTGRSNLIGISAAKRINKSCTLRWRIITDPPINPKIEVCVRTTKDCGRELVTGQWCGDLGRSDLRYPIGSR